MSPSNPRFDSQSGGGGARRGRIVAMGFGSMTANPLNAGDVLRYIKLGADMMENQNETHWSGLLLLPVLFSCGLC